MVWFITGASRGLGRALAKAVLARGDRVVATARDLAELDDLTGPEHGGDQDPVLRLRLDVTDTTEIEAAVEEAITREGRIDVLVNNAGRGFVGALEELTDAQIDSVFDTNVFGTMHVTRAVLPHMRAQRSGHVVQMSSVGGVVANPGHALYGASKFAIEGMSEALAGEVAEFGIHVTIIEPGPFRTDFAGRSIRYADQIDDYRDTAASELRKRFPEQDGAQPNDPARAAEAVLQAVYSNNPPLRLPLGPEAVRRIREKLKNQLADIDDWEKVAVDTRYAPS